MFNDVSIWLQAESFSTPIRIDHPPFFLVHTNNAQTPFDSRFKIPDGSKKSISKVISNTTIYLYTYDK